MNALTLQQVDRLFQPRRESCVSLYLPVTWEAGQWRQNETRLRHLLHGAETQLMVRGLPTAAIHAILTPARQMSMEQDLWLRGHPGLALFLTRENAFHLPLRSSVPERLLVEERFLVTPLIPLLQECEPFHLLAMSRNDVRFFHSDGATLQEMTVPDLPASLDAACEHHPAEPVRVVHGVAPRGKSSGKSVYHGQGNLRDHTKIDLARFARQIDEALKPVLQERPLPLVFAGVEELFAIYSEVNSFPRLLEQHLPGNQEKASPQELLAQASSIVANCKRREVARAIEACLSAPAERAAASLAAILPAATAGMVDLLVVQEQAQEWGVFDTAAGTTWLFESWHEGAEDLINQAVLETLRCRGQVYAANAEQLQGNLIAARFRYPLRSEALEAAQS